MYVALFLATLAPAVMVGIWRGGDSAVIAAVLIASFGGAHLAWGHPDPVMANAISDLICAALIVALCRSRWSSIVALLFIAAVACSVLEEMRGLVAYAHLLSAMGHAQNIGLIIGGRDGGKYHRTDHALRYVGAYR